MCRLFAPAFRSTRHGSHAAPDLDNRKRTRTAGAAATMEPEPAGATIKSSLHPAVRAWPLPSAAARFAAAAAAGSITARASPSRGYQEGERASVWFDVASKQRRQYLYLGLVHAAFQGTSGVAVVPQPADSAPRPSARAEREDGGAPPVAAAQAEGF